MPWTITVSLALRFVCHKLLRLLTPYCLLAVFFATAIIMPLQGLVIFGLIALFVDSSLRPPGGIGFAMNNNLEVLMIGGATAWIQ